MIPSMARISSTTRFPDCASSRLPSSSFASSQAETSSSKAFLACRRLSLSAIASASSTFALNRGWVVPLEVALVEVEESLVRPVREFFAQPSRDGLARLIAITDYPRTVSIQWFKVDEGYEPVKVDEPRLDICCPLRGARAQATDKHRSKPLQDELTDDLLSRRLFQVSTTNLFDGDLRIPGQVW